MYCIIQEPRCEPRVFSVLTRSEISQRRYERNDRIAVIVQNHSYVIILTRLKLPQYNVYGIQGKITHTTPILQTLTEIR